MNINKNDEKLEVHDDEKEILMDHNYDGIKELNHPLPSWWNTLFWLFIFYSVGYWAYYEFLGGPSLKEEFKKDFSVIEANQLAFKLANQKFNLERYKAFATDEGINKGKEVYEMNCLPCHAENGKGDIGPNLTDKHWLVAKGTPETIHQVIFNGSEANGMPIWGELISAEEVYQVTAYVATFKNTFQKGKGPEGVVIED